MHSTGSFLYTVLERIRAYLDDVDLDAKYSDDYIVRHIIGPAMVDIHSRLHNTNGCSIILKYEVTLTADDAYYKLPPCVQEVIRLVTTDDNGNVVFDAYPNDRQSLYGPGWSLEGPPGAMALVVDMPQMASYTCQVWYHSNGDVMPHYSKTTNSTCGTEAGVTAYPTVSSDGTTVTITETPDLGVMDRRQNSYAGQILRILQIHPSGGSLKSGRVVEEVIEAYDWNDAVSNRWAVTLRNPLPSEFWGAKVTYEIAPAGSQALYEAIAAWGAMKLGVARKIPQTQYQMLTQHYKQAMKTIGDNLTNIQTRRGHHYVKDTIDNPMNLGWGFSMGRH